MIRNLVFLDPAGVWQWAFEGPACTLGRDESNTVRLEDPLISRRHVLLEVRDDDTVWVVDLHSRNGIFQNGIRVPGSAPLADRDLLEIGTTRIRFLEMAMAAGPTQLNLPWDDLALPGTAGMARMASPAAPAS